MKARRKSRGSGKDKLDYVWARRHGLEPYGKFKRLLSTSLKRVPSAERKSILEKIYELAARKIRMEDEKEDAKETEQVVVRRLRPDRMKLVKVRQCLENAMKKLSVADTMFPRQALPWSDFSEMIDELDVRIANIRTFEILCADLVHPKIRSKAEKDTATFSGEKYPNFSLRLMKKHSEIDFGFITAVEQCLPYLPARGGKIDAERSKIISKVFAATFGQGGFSARRITKIRERLMKKPLTNNPFLTRQTP